MKMFSKIYYIVNIRFNLTFIPFVKQRVVYIVIFRINLITICLETF